MSKTLSKAEGPSRRCGNTHLPASWKAMASVLLTACVALGAGSPRTSRGAASPERSRGVLGVMAVRGQVWLGGVAVPAATAIYEGDTVRTAKDAAVVMRLRSGMTVALGEQGEVELAGSGTAEELRLKQGVMTVSQAGSSAGGRVEVLGRKVELRGRGGVAAVGRIAAVGQAAEVSAERGELDILGLTPASQRIHLQAGEVARLEVPSGEPGRGTASGRLLLRPSRLRSGAAAGAPQAVRKAGEVSGEIPAETIQRQGQGQPLKLNLHDAVNWNDLVQTLETGRVRIQLLDGSVLNVGARSQMHIIEHNPKTQQTQVELTLGRVRSQVVKLTKPGASFQMKTQTAVIGVVGTIFVVEATQSSTRVTCIEGKVTVENINPSVRGRVQLQEGQSTTVLTGAAPTAAAPANAAELQTAMERTEVQPGMHAAAHLEMAETTAGAQPVARGTAPGRTMSIGSTVAVAAGGVSAVAGVTALSKANDASDALNQTNTALANATAAGNAATTAINQSNQSTVSPSTPCGCGP
jgi:ferric-dicitrate binding protein FerR (iron transport regulator)